MAVLYEGIALDTGSGLRYAKFSFDYTDVKALAGTSANLTLCTLPQAAVVVTVALKHNGQFVFSGGVGTFKISIGTAAGVTLFTAASADLVATAVGDTAYTQMTAVPSKPGTHAAVALVANCVSSVANLSTLITSGGVDVYVLYANVTTPSA